MKYVVELANEETEVVDAPKYSVFGEINDNGDLTIYKNHYNMIMPISVAHYARGAWISATAEYD